MIKGIGASPGIAIGKAYQIKEEKIHVKREKIASKEIESEINRFQKGLQGAKNELQKIKNEMITKIGDEKGEIFNAHLMILEDPEMIPAIKNKILNEKINAEAAVKDIMEDYAQTFSEMDNEYMQERETDVRDVKDRLLRNLLKKERKKKEWDEEVIIVARNLTPSDTAKLDTDKVMAFVTKEGSRTSHSAIMARSLKVPAVVGIEEYEKIKNDQMLIVDGEEGIIITEPNDEILNKYKEKQRREKELINKIESYRQRKAKTRDGKKIEVVGNIGNIKDLDVVLEEGGEGVGLFRTEFLYMDRDELPSEEEQFSVYRKAAEKMSGNPVIIRTLDIGGDKDLPYLNLKEEMNPFLGYRAIRFCLEEKEIFKSQLKALLRASAYGNIKIMYPLISCLEEVKEANKLLKEARKELEEKGEKYNEPEVGIMIEVPAAVSIADLLAQEVDFFSIGTNDLIQYAMAVDRGNQKIAYLHSPYYPAVLRLIKKTIEIGHENNIWVGMCGEAAGEELLMPFLLGAGLDEFSMSAVSLLKFKYLLSQWTKEEAEEITEKVLKLETKTKVKEFLKEVSIK